MAAHSRRKAVSSAAGIKGVQAESAQPSSRGLHSGAIDGGMAQPLDSSRAGTLGALGVAAGGVAAAGASGQQAASQPRRSAAAEGWQQAEETGKLLAAGGVAGAVSKSATAPLARLTILYQVCCATSTVHLEYIQIVQRQVQLCTPAAPALHGRHR
jgi:hypothetical protein